MPHIDEFIRSEIKSVGDLLRAGAYAAARAQRDYCWDEENQSVLIDDLIAAFAEFGFDPDAAQDAAAIDEDAHPGEADGADDAVELADSDPALETSAPYYFLGTIVLQPEPDAALIYDGLQRITTLTILFAVLRDRLSDDALRAEIEPLLQSAPAKYRLALPMRHDTLVADVLTPGHTRRGYRAVFGLTPSGQRLRDGVAVARARTQGWNDARLAAFAAFVRDRVLISVISIDDRRLAGKAFVTINAHGVPLRPEEILKGQLIELAAAAPDPAKAEADILGAWRLLQEDLGAQFPEFIKAVDFLERRRPQADDHAIQLIDHVRRVYAGQRGLHWATSRLLQYRDAFKWLSEAADDSVASGVHASLRRLALLNWDMWRPLAMLVRLKTARTGELARRIDVVDRACFALHLQSLDSRTRASVIGRAIDRFAPKHGRFGKHGGFAFKPVAHEKIRRALYGPALDGPTRNVMIRWIEAAHHKHRVPRYLTRQAASSVEHVYPRNPQDNWPDFPADTQEAVTLRELMGNLCILPRDELENGDFQTKRKAYARMKDCLFAHEISKLRDWTPAQITHRTDSLARYTIGFLDFPVAP